MGVAGIVLGQQVTWTLDAAAQLRRLGIRCGLHPQDALIVAADGEDPISALNAAFVSDGGAIRIAAGATADAPIEFLFITTTSEPATVNSHRTS